MHVAGDVNTGIDDARTHTQAQAVLSHSVNGACFIGGVLGHYSLLA